MSRITLKQIICTPTYTTVIFLGALSSFASAANLKLPSSGTAMAANNAVVQPQSPIDLADLLGDGSTRVTATYDNVEYTVPISIK